MSLTLPQVCSMGSSQTGLVGNIGVELLNPDGTVKTARTTSGIYEIGGGTYGKEIAFDDNWSGVIVWDTGGGTPYYASIEYSIEGLIDTILEDTNELQTNQPNWLTATGFATPSEYDTDFSLQASLLNTIFGQVAGINGEAMRGTDDAADAVWGAAAIDHNNADSMGEAQNLLGDIFDYTSRLQYLAVGTAAPNTVAESVTIITGSETNTFEATHQLDDICNSFAPVGGVTDFYYQFDVGANGVPVSIQWQGYINGQGDTYYCRAYNWLTSVWDPVGHLLGSSKTEVVTFPFDLIIDHVGIGANAGKVRIKCYSSDGTNICTDRIMCAFATVYQSVGYANGAIWADTLVDNENTVSYIDGVADNPVSTTTAALVLSSQLGIKSFHVNNGSTIVLPSNCDNFTAIGVGWALDLNEQSCENASFEGATVQGLCSGSGTTFKRCTLAQNDSVSAEDIHAHGCALSGDIILTLASDYYLADCFSSMGGLEIPSIDFGDAVGSTSLKLRNYSGGIEIKNMGNTGIDNLSLEGNGQLVINSNCSGGTITIRGNFIITDNVVGGFVAGGGVIIEDARYVTSKIIGTPGKTNQEVFDNERGTESAYTGTPPTVTEIRQEMDSNSTRLDADISSRSNHSATDVKTSIEAVGSKLTEVKDQTDKMGFTGADIKATLDGEEVVTDTASRVASKATGFATENPPSQNLDDYKGKNTEDEIKTALDNYTNKDTYKASISGVAPPHEYDVVLAAIAGDVGGLDGDPMRGSDGVPTNPLLTNDARLDTLDVTISSRSSHGDPTVGIIGTPGKTNQQVFDNEKGTDGAYTGTPPTPEEIRAELESAGTKLTTVKDQTDKLNFTGDDIKATLDGELVITDTASRTASKATGFSTHTPIAVKEAIEAEGSKLSDVHDEALGGLEVDHIAKTLTLYRIDGTILKVYDLPVTGDVVPTFIGRVPR